MKRLLAPVALVVAGCATPTTFSLKEELRSAYVGSGFLVTKRPALYSEVSAKQGPWAGYLGHFETRERPRDREHDVGASYTCALDEAVAGLSATMALDRYTFPSQTTHALEEPSLKLAWAAPKESAFSGAALNAKYVYSRADPGKGSQLVLRAEQGFDLWGDAKPDVELAVQEGRNDHYFRDRTGWAYLRSEAVFHLVQEPGFSIDLGAHRWDRQQSGLEDRWVGLLSVTIPLGSVGGEKR